MIRKLTSISSLALCLMLMLSTIFSAVTFAAGSQIYVTPNSGSLQPGQSITVQVKGDIATGTWYGADTVSGTLQFPANLLKVTNVSTSGATFNWQVSATPGSGVVNFNERAFFASDNTSVFIMSVTFQALAAGTANVGFSSTTRFSSSQFSANFPTGLSGGAYSISNPVPTTCPSGQIGTPPNCTTPPPATCPSGQIGTPPNCTTPTPAKCPAGQTGTPPNCKSSTPSSGGSSSSNNSKNTPTPTPAAETPTEPIPAPQENGLSINDASTTRAYKSAELNWKTSASAKNTVTYGTSLKSLDKTAEVSQDADGSYTAKLSDLTPGKRYYFTINSTSEKDPTKTSTYSGVFTTKGYPVAITITEDGQAANSAKIKISEQTYSTDKSGKIGFELASGAYSIEVTTSKESKKFTLTVAEKTIPDGDKAPDTQNFTFDVPTDSGSANGGISPFAILGIGVGGLALLGLFGGAFLFWRRRRTQDATATGNVDNDYTWAAQQPLPAFPQDQQPVEQFNTAPIDPQYAAPPDMLPPQEIMPPDQAAAMAIQSLPPTPDDIETPPSEIIDQGTMPQEINQPIEDQAVTQPDQYTSQPQDTSIDAQPYSQESDPGYLPEQLVAQDQPIGNETTSTQEEQVPQADIAPAQELEVEHDDETPDPESPSDEPGLTEAPPTMESGGGELQIEHHPSDAQDNDNTSSAVALPSEATETK